MMMLQIAGIINDNDNVVFCVAFYVVLCWVWFVFCMLLMLISHGTVGQTVGQENDNLVT